MIIKNTLRSLLKQGKVTASIGVLTGLSNTDDLRDMTPLTKSIGGIKFGNAW